jgi:hypothetical protein
VPFRRSARGIKRSHTACAGSPATRHSPYAVIHLDEMTATVPDARARCSVPTRRGLPPTAGLKGREMTMVQRSPRLTGWARAPEKPHGYCHCDEFGVADAPLISGRESICAPSKLRSARPDVAQIRDSRTDR